MKASYTALRECKNKKVVFLKSDIEAWKNDVLSNLGMPAEPAAANKNNPKAVGCGCLTVIVLCIMFGVIFSSCPSKENVPLIDETLFNTTVITEMTKLNKDNVVSKIETSVSDNIAFAYIYLSSTDGWNGLSETDRKEFINDVGGFIDSAALVSRTKAGISGDDRIFAATIIKTPGGVKLGERDVLGNVKLE